MAESVALKEVSSAGESGEKTYLLSGDERTPSAKRVSVLKIMAHTLLKK